MINKGRFVLGGVIATIICFGTDGLMHNKIVKGAWDALFTALGYHPVQGHDAMAFLYFILFEIGRGFLALTLYVLLRPRLQPGVKTAVIAGLITWLAFSVTGPVQMVPLGLYSVGLWWQIAAVQLVTTILAAVAGAAPYKE
ncbi:MAG: hypothetical protein IT381_13980 [Deltaproteobacteria bacterium]|nr:hypothetical protein [Deltaproteobacteria bacterium]